MGAKENKALSKKMYDALLAKNLPGFLACCSKDVKITAPGCQALLPWRVSVTGLDNVPGWLMFMNQHISMDKVEPQQYIADEDKVVIFVKETLTVQSNKRTFQLDEVHVHTHRDGKIVDVTMYEDTVRVLAEVRGKDITEM